MNNFKSRQPTAREWPKGGLETVSACPVCAFPERRLLYEGLLDLTFEVAPGKWNLWSCLSCGSAYLDPRPTPSTIGLAYAEYYTHDDTPLPEPKGAFGRLRARLANGYRNRRYGDRLRPASSVGALIGTLLPPLRWPIDVAYRYMPKQPGRVLDVGSGDGSFLKRARGAGWDVAGVEPDPLTRIRSEAEGLDVRPAISDWSMKTQNSITSQ